MPPFIGIVGGLGGGAGPKGIYLKDVGDLTRRSVLTSLRMCQNSRVRARVYIIACVSTERAE